MHKRAKIPYILRAAVRIAPIAFTEPVAFGFRYASGTLVQLLFRESDPTSHWQYVGGRGGTWGEWGGGAGRGAPGRAVVATSNTLAASHDRAFS